jgi:hypothetical protein
VSNVYKPISGTFQVPSPGYYYAEVRATSTSGSAQYLTWDDLRIEIPCSVNAPTLNASGADTYMWSTGDQGSILTVTPGFAGMHTYQVTGTSALSGCQTMGQQVIVVNPAPVINVFANPPATCPGKPVTLQAFGGSNYLWSNNATGAVTTVAPPSTASYSVSASNVHNCQASAVVDVTVYPAANILVQHPVEACVGDLVMLDASGGLSYQFISSANYQVTNPAQFIMTGPIQYTVTGTDGNGCQDTEVIFVSEATCTGLSQLGISGLRVFPNPTTGEFTIKLDAAEAGAQVIDVTGRVVLEATTTNGAFNINIGHLANGIYTVKVKANDNMEVIRVIRN